MRSIASIGFAGGYCRLGGVRVANVVRQQIRRLDALFPSFRGGDRLAGHVLQQPLRRVADERNRDDQALLERAFQLGPLGLQNGDLLLVRNEAGDIRLGRAKPFLARRLQVLGHFEHHRDRFDAGALEQIHRRLVAFPVARHGVKVGGDLLQHLRGIDRPGLHAGDIDAELLQPAARLLGRLAVVLHRLGEPAHHAVQHAHILAGRLGGERELPDFLRGHAGAQFHILNLDAVLAQALGGFPSGGGDRSNRGGAEPCRHADRPEGFREAGRGFPRRVERVANETLDVAAHRLKAAAGFAALNVDHLRVRGGDAVDHALFVAELLDEPIPVSNEAVHARLAVRGSLLFDGGGKALHGRPGTVVHFEQHVGHAFQRLLHPVAGADRVLLPSINSRVGLLDGRKDCAGIEIEGDGFLVHFRSGFVDFSGGQGVGLRGFSTTRCAVTGALPVPATQSTFASGAWISPRGIYSPKNIVRSD